MQLSMWLQIWKLLGVSLGAFAYEWPLLAKVKAGSSRDIPYRLTKLRSLAIVGLIVTTYALAVIAPIPDFDYNAGVAIIVGFLVAMGCHAAVFLRDFGQRKPKFPWNDGSGDPKP